MAEIKGYRQLSDRELVAINDIKDVEVAVGELWRQVSYNLETVDKRWLALAKTHLQEGFMAFVRAIAKPEDVF